MSRRGSVAKGCTRKGRFGSSVEARQAMLGMAKRTGTALKGMWVYRCGRAADKHWHYGHEPRPLRRMREGR